MQGRRKGKSHGNVRQEHLAPESVFSCVFFSQVQFMADCLPHEQVAFSAQTQLSERPQQVVGLTMLTKVRVVLGKLIGRGDR